MPRVVIDRAVADGASLENEIARLRSLDVGKLRARWHTMFRRVAPPHLPRHLLFRILAYRLQADQFGDLDANTRVGWSLAAVMVLPDGFTWNGKAYRSLSKVAFAITGSRWNGPRFFGLRDRPSSEAQP